MITVAASDPHQRDRDVQPNITIQIGPRQYSYAGKLVFPLKETEAIPTTQRPNSMAMFRPNPDCEFMRILSKFIKVRVLGQE